MPELSYVKALEALDSGVPDSRAWFIQTDKPMMWMELGRLLQRTVVPEHADFNVTRIDCASHTGAGEIEAAGEELPIMAQRRLLSIFHVHLLDHRQMKRLADYLADASPTTWFFITAGKLRKADDKDRAVALKAIADTINEHGTTVKDTMRVDELAIWLRRCQAAYGVELDGRAVKCLLERTNNVPERPRDTTVKADLDALNVEVQKLACFAGASGRVTADDVEALVHDSASTQVWKITEAAGKRDIKEALEVLDRLLTRELHHPLVVLGMLASHYRKLLRVRALDDPSRAPDHVAPRIAEATGFNEWVVKTQLLPNVRRPLLSLEDALEGLMAADVALKSGASDERFVLEMLLLRLCGADRSPSGPRGGPAAGSATVRR